MTHTHVYIYIYNTLHGFWYKLSAFLISTNYDGEIAFCIYLRSLVIRILGRW
jgi:hypothetical protein